MKRMQSLRQRLERGHSLTLQGIFYLVALWMLFGLVYDLGQVAYVSSILRSAAISAAQDAAKSVDEQYFMEHQEIRLSGEAFERAQRIMTNQTHGIGVVGDISVVSQVDRELVVLTASARVHPRILSAFGVADFHVPVQVYAEPSYGIEEEYQ